MEGNSGRGGGTAGGRGRGRGRGRGGGGRGNNQNQGGGRGWEAPHRGPHHQPPAQQQWVGRPPVQGNQPSAQQAWGYRQPQAPPSQRPSQQGVAPAGGSAGSGSGRPWAPASGSAGSWTGRPWGPSASSSTPVQSLPPSKALSQPSPGELGLQKLKISEEKAESSSPVSKENQIEAIRRPDTGGTVAIRSIRLLVNHFPVKYDTKRAIFHYDVDVKPISNDNTVVRRTLKKPDMRMIKDKVFSEHQFPILKSAYDGEKSIFSAVNLPTGEFRVEIPEGEEAKSGLYTVTIKFVNQLMLSKLSDYIRGNLPSIPRDILQGMDLVFKDNPTQHRIMVGRSFYSSEYQREDDLYYGIAAYKGFQQSLKPTSRGLALCLDYSVLAFRKPLPVLDYLREYVPQFGGANDVKRLRKEIEDALKGLKVRVTHRRTKQKYTIAGLAAKDARDSSFELVDTEGKNPPRVIGLVEYFRDKWGKDIMFKNIPCLELGKPGKSNEVPMEFCVLVEGQRYPKEHLDKDTALFLKKLSLARPWDRRNTINEMVRSADGPCGDVMRNFGFGVDTNMTKVVGRVIGAPDLKLGASRSVKVDDEKRQWNLLGKYFLDAKSLERWVLLDFTDGDRYNKLQANAFVNNLRGRCRNLGIQMAEPLLHRVTRMSDFSSVDRLEKLLRDVVDKSKRISQEKLQMIVCVMTRKDPGYKNLKWLSETKIGVVTQCCLSSHANKGQDQYLANLCLKINAKLGGSNFELSTDLPHFGGGDHVMFIGADVNHPAAYNTSCPSIAAVVGTINWPAANCYAARVRPQAHRTEKIIDFGDMCVDLIRTYAQLNKVRPTKIIVFRDGVSEGQIKMVLSEELFDLKKALHNYDSHYNPAITIVVAQKRHQTRLFVENRNDGGSTGNVPPGTVVDTDIIHPRDFDFYLCSHYGGLGTSKPTHYYVLWDENGFSSDELQKLIYDMCFTFARCTKPVSLVPPVYYADLVAYRGRMFQEVVMDTQYRGASSSTASFNQSFYNLHSDLENVMFFV
ncbi:Translation initiation factor 2C (eIF-2C) [Handroanthus impetiginosus]|uniref:Translation initiation factor 2C (eIF-2C) n=2 Tax=Handroanthus impetiginosus TaxID=429701 RepID=A0A2G9HYX5_9LAMI|nr:Translation initiation factor 2C (eIF-2C) [Handroanthus impetiginosus]